jgi:hypothetical protein
LQELLQVEGGIQRQTDFHDAGKLADHQVFIITGVFKEIHAK